MHPGLVRIIALGAVFSGWALTAIGGYFRGLKKQETIPYCPRCKHDMASMPEGECRNCGWTSF